MRDLCRFDEVYCFLDTDVLIHFTTFDHVDWVTFLEAKKVYLVLPITVIHELNKHKDDGSKPGLQQRARNLLSKIAGLLVGATDPVRIKGKQDVFLMGTIKEPRIEWSMLELDENVQDDRILARLLLFKDEYPERNICFLTNDYAALLKADDRGIRTLMPDQNLLAPRPLKSTMEAELEATRKELSEYKNRAPQLVFGFDNEQAVVFTIVCTSSEYSIENAEVLTHALDKNYVPKQVIKQKEELQEILSLGVQKGIAAYDIKEYTEEYEIYLQKLEIALKRELMSKYGRRISLPFLIQNVGTAPVTDLTIELVFPPGTLVIDARDEKEEILVPKEPKASWIPRNVNAWGIGLASPVGTFIRRDPTYDLLHEVRRSQATYSGPLCQQTGKSHLVSYHAKKLRHGGGWSMPSIIAYVVPDNRQGFSIQYDLFSDQGLRKTSGALSVQWKGI